MVFLWLDVWRYIWDVKNKINCGIQLNKLAKLCKLFTSVITFKLKEEFINRSKIGWDAPDSKWFRKGLDEILNYYVNTYDSGFFNKKELRKKWV